MTTIKEYDLKPEEAKAILGVGRNTFYKMIENREIEYQRKAPKIIRFNREDLDKWLESRVVKPLTE